MSILDAIFPHDEGEGIPGVGPLSSFETDDELRLLLSCKGHNRILTAVEASRRLAEMGFRVSEEAEFVLKQAYSAYGEEYALLSVVRNAESTHDVMRTAKKLRLRDCPVALAYILREMTFDYQLRDFGLKTLVIMHQPILGSEGSLCQLALCCGDEEGDGWLDVYYGCPDGSVEPKVGFAFFVP
ncbi:MAG: hypothetical protein NUW00_03200 [Candidatus Kaiserbacteria bacterium]|nr:hypothetical protein [Candidatus Kaiserbacteria bacterium]